MLAPSNQAGISKKYWACSLLATAQEGPLSEAGSLAHFYPISQLQGTDDGTCSEDINWPLPARLRVEWRWRGSRESSHLEANNPFCSLQDKHFFILPKADCRRQALTQRLSKTASACRPWSVICTLSWKETQFPYYFYMISEEL